MDRIPPINTPALSSQYDYCACTKVTTTAHWKHPSVKLVLFVFFGIEAHPPCLRPLPQFVQVRLQLEMSWLMLGWYRRQLSCAVRRPAPAQENGDRRSAGVKSWSHTRAADVELHHPGLENEASLALGPTRAFWASYPRKRILFRLSSVFLIYFG